MCSELTPRAPIPDTRIPQLMQPCYLAVLGSSGLYWAVLGCTVHYWAVFRLAGGPGCKGQFGPRTKENIMTKELTGRFSSQFTCICITWLEWLLLQWKSSNDALSENLPLVCTAQVTIYCKLHRISSFVSPMQFSFIQATGSPGLDIWIGQISMSTKTQSCVFTKKKFCSRRKGSCQNKVCFSPNRNHQRSEE